ncbi:MAG: leucine-rich repeat protein [Oscillospiraceae bacterium]|nr:leucine-rich repeat protein [Oscillospiraceae bacterium]
MKRQIAATMTALTMLCTAIPMAAVAEMSITASAAEYPTSGVCGDNLTWEYDEEAKTLTISGTGDMYDYSDKTDGKAPWYLRWTSCKKIVVKDGVTSIGNWAFYWFSETTSISIPDSVERIGDYSVCACYKLTTFRFPSHLKEIGLAAFMNDEGLTAIDVPDSVEKLGDFAFSYTSTNDIKLPAGIRTIPASLFSCAGLTEFTIPDTVTTIGHGAFAGTKLTRIEIPEGVISVDGGAFCDCKELKEIVFWNPRCRIYDGSGTICTEYDPPHQTGSYSGSITGFDGSPAEAYAEKYGIKFESMGTGPQMSYSCGDDLTWDLDANGTLTISGTGEMDSYFVEHPAPWTAFPDDIKNVVIEPGCTFIGMDAFAKCEKIQTVSLPDTIEAIGDGAFRGCKSLRTITIPEGVTSISSNLFADCTSLACVFLPDSVVAFSGSAFSGCESLVCVTKPDNNILEYYSKRNKAAARFALAKSEPELTATLPAKLTILDESAFKGCKSLTTVIIPEGVTRIQASVFAGCEKLASISMPDGITYIDENAFNGCTSLTSVDVPEKVEFIGKHAFENCTSLQSAALPQALTSIMEGGFSGCSALKSITIPESVVLIGENAFCNCAALDTVTIANPLCMISGTGATFCNSYDAETETATFDGTFYVQPNSFVEQYAEDSGYACKDIAEAPTSEEPQETERALGNVNDDEIVNASDAAVILIAAAAMGAGGESSLNEAQMQAADVNKDENVNASDAAIVLIYAASVGAGNTDAKITDFVK